MKKIMPVLLAILMLLSAFADCNSKEDEKPTAPTVTILLPK